METMRRRFVYVMAALVMTICIVLIPREGYAAGTVTGLKQTYGTGNTATITWSKYSGAKYYNVYYATSSKGGYKRINENNQELQYHFTNLRQGRTYYAKVYAYNSKKQKIAQSAALPIVTAPVGQVKNLKITKTTTDSISVSWSKVSGAGGYLVQCFSNGEKSSSKKISTTNTTMKNLSADAVYTIMVVPYKKSTKGFYAYGWESERRIYNGMTALAKPEKLNASTVYSMPSYLPQAKGYIEVKWSGVQGADGYEYVLYDSATGKLTEKKNVKKLKVILRNVDNRVYQIKVRAYSRSGKQTTYSSWAETFHSVGVSMEGYECNTASTEITVNWSQVSGAAAYEVYVSFGDAVHYNKLRSVTASTTTISWPESKEDMIFIKILAVRKTGNKTYRFMPKDVQYVGR